MEDSIPEISTPCKGRNNESLHGGTDSVFDCVLYSLCYCVAYGLYGSRRVIQINE